MSQANVQIMRSLYEAQARGDAAAVVSYLDPDIEFSQPADEPGGGTYYGPHGVLKAYAGWVELWDDYTVAVESLTPFGDHVLAKTRHRARGKGSGVEVEHLIFQVWTLRAGKVVRATMYYDEAEALDAVGLER